MAAPVIKQIQGTLKGSIFIAVGSILLAISYGGISGELKSWHSIWGIADHAALIAFALVCGWIVLASPFAPDFQTYLASAKKVRLPDGTMTEESSISVGGAQQPGTTVTIDPASAKVTIKEDAKPDAH